MKSKEMAKPQKRNRNNCEYCMGDMQFAVINIAGKDLTISACELDTLDNYKSFELVEDSSGLIDVQAFGAYIPNRGVAVDKAKSELNEWKGYAFISFNNADKKAYLSELVDFELGDPIDGFLKIPIIVHIRTTLDIPLIEENTENYAKVLSLFLSNLEPVESILNRNGFLALTGRVKTNGSNLKQALNTAKLRDIADSVGRLYLGE